MIKSNIYSHVTDELKWSVAQEASLSGIFRLLKPDWNIPREAVARGPRGKSQIGVSFIGYLTAQGKGSRDALRPENAGSAGMKQGLENVRLEDASQLF
jgi:hypothetical protein